MQVAGVMFSYNTLQVDLSVFVLLTLHVCMHCSWGVVYVKRSPSFLSTKEIDFVSLF